MADDLLDDLERLEVEDERQQPLADAAVETFTPEETARLHLPAIQLSLFVSRHARTLQQLVMLMNLHHGMVRTPALYASLQGSLFKDRAEISTVLLFQTVIAFRLMSACRFRGLLGAALNSAQTFEAARKAHAAKWKDCAFDAAALHAARDLDELKLVAFEIAYRRCLADVNAARSTKVESAERARRELVATELLYRKTLLLGTLAVGADRAVLFAHCDGGVDHLTAADTGFTHTKLDIRTTGPDMDDVDRFMAAQAVFLKDVDRVAATNTAEFTVLPAQATPPQPEAEPEAEPEPQPSPRRGRVGRRRGGRR